jgi:hypothetical protein
MAQMHKAWNSETNEFELVEVYAGPLPDVNYYVECNYGKGIIELQGQFKYFIHAMEFAIAQSIRWPLSTLQIGELFDNRSIITYVNGELDNYSVVPNSHIHNAMVNAGMESDSNETL